ncbi:efflux RND transporter periplasmic adaptor subunit [Glaciecola sp. 1036]|uniref:efflux RND transporter periplasmic adaptor subunit n=1 Tax=Alteromonadaceae TaxID=72275 RepID=UPI003D0585A2
MKDSSQVDLQRSGISTFKAIVIAIILIALISAGLWFWRSAKLENAGGWHGGGAIDVVASQVTLQAAPVTVQAFGEVRAVNQVMLSAEVAGRISELNISPGQRVSANTLIVQLDDATEQADLVAAKASIKFAQEQLERAKDLHQIDALSNEILQQRQADYDIAKSQINQLQARIRYKKILAPFDGELGLRQVDLGQYLNPGEPVVSLTDTSQVFVNFNLPQDELARIDIGHKLQVYSEIAPDQPIEAQVTAIEQQINPDTRNITLQAKVNNQDKLLRAGMFVKVDLIFPSQTNAIVLPSTAVMTSSSGNTAVVVRGVNNEQIGTAEIVPVQIERRLGDQVVISQGLSAGDLVVTRGQLRVRPGAQLKVISNTASVGGQ